MEKLGNLVSIRTGKLDANASSENGVYPFFTCAVEPLKIDTYSYDCECVLVAGNGDLNVKYYNGKFDAYQRTYIVESKNKEILTVPYLFLFLNKYVETLRKQAIGGVIKYIKLGNLTEANISIISLDKQKEVVKRLSKIDELISLRRIELEKLNLIIKSRFIEMFGNLEYTTKNMNIKKLYELCCVTSSKRIHKCELTNSGIPFLRISDIVNKIDNNIETYSDYISTTKYENLKKNFQVPEINDILVTARGTLGKCYIIKENDKFYFQDGMISWLSRLDTCINTIYISYLFSTNYTRNQIKRMQAGSTVSYFSINMLKNLDIVVPPIELQNQFATFVVQTDKSKLHNDLEVVA